MPWQGTITYQSIKRFSQDDGNLRLISLPFYIQWISLPAEKAFLRLEEWLKVWLNGILQKGQPNFSQLCYYLLL